MLEKGSLEDQPPQLQVNLPDAQLSNLDLLKMPGMPGATGESYELYVNSQAPPPKMDQASINTPVSPWEHNGSSRIDLVKPSRNPQATPVPQSQPTTFTTLETDLAKPFTLRFAPDRNIPSRSSSPEDPGGISKISSNEMEVDWASGEPANPYNWKKGFKWLLTFHLAINCLCPVFLSSSYVAGIEDILVKFPGTSLEVATLGLSLYLIGQAFGPVVWAPTSEIIGRRQAYLISFPIFVLFNLGGAVSNDVSSLLVTRFFAGWFGSAQMSNLGGQMADIWIPEERLIPGALAALSPLLGPVLGPILGGFAAQYSGYKAVLWMQFGFSLVTLVFFVFFVPETYAPTLLKRKTKLLQEEADRTGTDVRYMSKYDKGRKPVKETLIIGFSRPFAMLFKEVIVLTLSLYLSIIYGILYLLFNAFPVVFQQHRGFTLSQTGLALLGIGIGMIFGFFLSGIGRKFYDKAKAELPPGVPPPPEVRLPTMIIGSILVPIGLFGFAWTALPPVPWILPILLSVFFGAGYLLIFTSILLYLIDSYGLYGASALAANTVMRCAFGAGFPLFAQKVFDGLGVHWAGSLLAFLALACAPMPLLFYRYGPYLRRKSSYAPSQTHLVPLNKGKSLPDLPAEAETQKENPYLNLERRSSALGEEAA